MNVKPCPHCGGKIMQVIKLCGNPTDDLDQYDEFESYIYCTDCDDLEESGAQLSDFMEPKK